MELAMDKVDSISISVRGPMVYKAIMNAVKIAIVAGSLNQDSSI